MITFKIITIFPEMFAGYLSASLMARAQNIGAISVEIYNLRDWADDLHRSVDDKPFGGGAGMVMRIETLHAALTAVAGPSAHKVLLSARGRRFTEGVAVEYSKQYQEIVLICGRFEGVDERLLEFIDEEYTSN